MALETNAPDATDVNFLCGDSHRSTVIISDMASAIIKQIN